MKKAAHEQQASVSPYLTSSNCVAMTHDYENCFEDAFQLRHFQVTKNSFYLGFLFFFCFQTAHAKFFSRC